MPRQLRRSKTQFAGPLTSSHHAQCSSSNLRFDPSPVLGLEIGTSQGTLPVGAGRFGRTPHIVLAGAFLALRAPDCNGWPPRWVPGGRRDGTQEEPAGFRPKLTAWRVLSYSGLVMRANELQHGKLYDCTMDGDDGIVKTTIVPLAADTQTSQRYIIIDAKSLQKANPDLLRRLLAMSFQEIVDEDLDGGPDRHSSCFVWRFTLDEHGSLYYEDYDCYLGDFVEADTTK